MEEGCEEEEIVGRFAHMMRDPRTQPPTTWNVPPTAFEYYHPGYPVSYAPIFATHPYAHRPWHTTAPAPHDAASTHPEDISEESNEEPEDQVAPACVRVRSSSWLLVSCQYMFDESTFRVSI